MAAFLVFGDLHGRVLPAFRLAAAWSRAHGVRVDGILQVGDLGYFPDNSRLDKATRRFAIDDPMELGVQLVTEPSPEADAVFADPDVPEALWFTAGNHEDFEALTAWEHGSGPRATRFAVDRRTRKQLPPRGWIHPKAASRLLGAEFDVLLSHDCPMGAMHSGCGSEDVDRIIRFARPRFAFFGHYRGKGAPIESDFGDTTVFHLAGMELRRHRLYPEEGCVGVLRWRDGAGEFTFLDPVWLLQFPRDRWREW
jgi:hypothetical protein